jgi:hypothetical protein
VLCEAKNGRQITLPAYQTQALAVRLAGTAPLITNRFGPARLQRIADEQSGAAKTLPGAREPEAEFREALHAIDADAGRYGVPAAALKRALVRAGSLVGEPMTRTRCLVHVRGSLLEITGAAPVMRTDTVKLHGRSGSVWSIAYRPEFWPWEIEALLPFSPELGLTEERLLNMVRVAGIAVGIGAWRPECNGSHGTFAIAAAELRSL